MLTRAFKHLGDANPFFKLLDELWSFDAQIIFDTIIVDYLSNKSNDRQMPLIYLYSLLFLKKW